MAPTPAASSLITALANQTREGISVTQIFRKGDVVGKGAFGSVHRGIHIGTGSVVALKIVNLDIADDDVEAIQKEVALLSQLRGGETTNVTQYYGCWLDGPQVWIAMDFASGGSVRTLMKAAKGGVLEERHVVIIVREVLIALAFLHKSGVIHRDIKGANVLVTAKGNVVLCDFGVSGLLATQYSKRATTVGTPYWMAPEVINKQPYDTKADIWSLGVTIYEMMMKTPPHSDQPPVRAFILITEGPPPRLPESTGASKDMRDFMACCLKELPSDRMTAEELQKQLWIKRSKAPVTALKELLSSYNGWVQQGGVRESIIGDNDLGYVDNEDAEIADWEFETVRFPSDAGGSSTVAASNSVPDMTPAVSSSYQAPRSLRMLFEDSSQPPALSESFLRNNLGSSRHGGQAIGVAASAPNPSFLNPGSAPGNSDFLDPSSVPDDSGLSTARQPNFSFPRVVTPNAEYEDNTARLPQRRGHHSPRGSAARRSPSPLKDFKSPPGSPSMIKAATTFRDVRNNKGFPDIAIPPPGHGSAPGSSGSPADAAGGMPSISVGRAETPTRPDTSMSSYDDGSPKPQAKMKKAASPMNFQFPPAGARPAKVSAPGRPHTPSSKENGSRLGTSFQEASILASQGLSPPKPLNLHHPASRSMDSPRSAVGPGPSTVLSPPMLGRSYTAAVYGSQSDSEALGKGLDGTRLVPGRSTPLKRQASVETGLSMGQQRNGGLREALQLSAAVPSGPLQGDFLPPSPSTSMSYTGRGFTAAAHQIEGDLPLAASSTNSSLTQVSNVSTSFHSANTSASTSISSAVSVSGYGPIVRPFNYSSLMTGDDVQSELAKVVEELATWLGVVENGLTGVLEGAGYGKSGALPADAALPPEEEEEDAYEYEAVEEDQVSLEA